MEKKVIKIGYVHGYLGSSTGQSFQRLKKYLPEGFELIGIDYDDSDPEKAIEDIRSRDFDMLIGSSLGGFYVLHAWGVPRIVINPCYYPSIELPKLERNEFTFNPKFAELEKDFKKYNDQEERMNVTGIFGVEDELMGTKYVKEFYDDFDYAYLINSKHRISEDGAEFIMSDVLKETLNRVNNYSAFIKQMSSYEF